MSKKKSLGRGLSALLSEDVNNIEKSLNSENPKNIKDIKLKDIEANEYQPREIFDEEKLMELSESIKTYGVIQPILLREIKKGKYEIIAGERRYRASKIAKKETIPSIVLDIDLEESAKLALIENIQREDLNPIEEALGFENLIKKFKVTQTELSKVVGKSRAYISNSIRLLNLSDKSKEELIKENITVGHGKLLLSIKDEGVQNEILQEIIEKKLSVRETEKLIKNRTKDKKPEEKTVISEEIGGYNYLRIIEDEFIRKLGTKVKLKEGKNKGIIEIEYYSEDDLQRIYEEIID